MDLLKRALHLLDRPTKVRIGVAFVLSTVMAGLDAIGIGLVLPFVQVISDPGAMERVGLFRGLRDLLGGGDRHEFIVVLGVVIFLLFLLKTVLALGFLYWELGFLARAEGHAAADLLDGYLHAPYEMHLRRNSAELLRNIQISLAAFYSYIVMSAVNLMADLSLLVAVFAVLLIHRPAITGAGLVLGTLAAYVYQVAVRRRTDRVGKQSHIYSMESFQYVNQALGGVKESKLLGRTGVFVDAFRESRLGGAEARRQFSFLQSLPRYYLELTMVLSVLVLGAVLFSRGDDANGLAVLGLFAAAGFRLMPSLNRILVSLNSVRYGREAALVLEQDRALLLEHRASDVPPVAMPLQARIDLEHVSFRYEGGANDVLRDVECSIHKGEWIGIVGSSGAGKSTFIDVLMGLLTPTSGRVLLDGQDIRTNVTGWQALIGYVPQEIYLIDDTLARNIAFGVPDGEVDMDRLREVIDLAELASFLEELPAGLATEVGERGVRLSGGQRQRIGLARALYRRPSVLILDEATSALDNETESRVQATVEALRSGMTLVTVAHRLSTVRSCDRLLLLEAGAIAAAGSFDELCASNEQFARLVQLGHLGAAPL